jgi:hypothetical protein
VGKRLHLRIDSTIPFVISSLLLLWFLLISDASVVRWRSQPGFSDGPFTGTPINEDVYLGLAAPEFTLPFRRGTIEIFNRQPSQPPAILYRRRGRAVWAVEMTTSVPYDNYRQYRTLQAPKIRAGVMGAVLQFRAEFSTPGWEPGWAYFDSRGFESFFLSW